MTYFQRLIQGTEKDRRLLLEQPVISDCLSGKISLETCSEALEHLRKRTG